MVLRKEFQGVKPEKNPHRDAYRDVTGGGKKERKKKMWEENCKTLEILNPRISETIILKPQNSETRAQTHPQRQKKKKTETQKKRKQAERRCIINQLGILKPSFKQLQFLEKLCETEESLGILIHRARI
jgi:hypothetical protein